ncbi:CRACD-like protein isoform 2-T2 [Dugong dugon]
MGPDNNSNNIELDMISTRVLRESAEGIGEDGTVCLGKKKSKFKTFKKFFGKKKRKESPSSTGSSTWKQSREKSEDITFESGPVGYGSEDELEESRGVLGSRALSHDSIFIPESGQDPARPVRVFSQENVSDRIKALQLKIQCHVKMGPPPPPGGLLVKRGDDTGMSSEDDGLPRSPPEMALLHDGGPGTTVKVSLVSSSRPLSPDHTSDASVFPRTSDSGIAPTADFSYPPEFSSCLDNSAAKHKLLVKPRNQRSSKMRRLSSRAQSESLSDLTCTPEEEEYDEKPLPKVSTEENPSSEQQDLGPDGGPELGEPAPVQQPGGARARRARLQHCPALSTSMEEGSLPGDGPSSPPATPEVSGPESGPALCSEAASLPEGSAHPDPDSENQREGLPIADVCPPAVDTADEAVCASGDSDRRLSVCTSREDTAPAEAVTATTLETPSRPEGPDQNVRQEVELTLAEPSPEGAGKEPSAAPAPSPQPPKSCLKHKAQPVSVSRGASPTPPASEVPPGESAPCLLDREAAPAKLPKADHAESPQGVPVRAAPEQKVERGGGEPVSVKKLSVSCRARPCAGSIHPLEQPGPGDPSGVRLPLLKSGLAWRSEAALDDLQVLPGPQGVKLDPQKPPSPAECDSQDSGDPVAQQALLGGSPQEPPSCEDRNAFPVKLRSTSLSFRYRDGSSSEQKGVKRYSAEVRLEKGGLTLLSRDEKCQLGTPPGARGARSLNDQGKVKARSSEQLSSKPPLPRKPLLQTLTLPQLPTPPQAGPGKPEKTLTPQDSKKESRMVEKKSPHRVAAKGLSPAAAGPVADGQPMPSWITIARQKRRGAPDQPPNQEDGPGVQSLKSEVGKPAKTPERAQESRQADFVRSKSFLIVPAKPPVEQKLGTKLDLTEGLQRGISVSHQNLAQSVVMMEKELNHLKRASYASVDQPSWMELARKKSQAWSDMPQIIK